MSDSSLPNCVRICAIIISVLRERKLSKQYSRSARCPFLRSRIQKSYACASEGGGRGGGGGPVSERERQGRAGRGSSSSSSSSSLRAVRTLSSVRWSELCTAKLFLMASASSRLSKGDMKGFLKDMEAAMVSTGSTQRKMQPKSIILPMRGSTGSVAR